MKSQYWSNASPLVLVIALLMVTFHDGKSEPVTTGGSDDRPVLLHTKKGTLRGLREESVSGRPFLSFYAIPYAKPPMAELRFQDPVEEEAWEGVRDAASQPEPCIQVSFRDAKKGDTIASKIVGVEDCLYLNVFTPEVGVRARLPVMVYLHGGGYVGSSANEFAPNVLLDHQVVLVVAQFRLGTLGFLSTEDGVMSGNYMLKDQIAALQWIQRNIRTFGGDTDKVTMFGESSGAMSTSLLSLSPRAEGLFARVALHSGTPMMPFTLGRWHRRIAEETARSLGFSGNLDSESMLSFFRTVPASSLVLVPYKYYTFFILPSVMGPRVDGDLIPEEPHKMLATRTCPSWELITGYTAQDGGLLTVHFYLQERVRKSMEENFAKFGPISLGLDEHPNGETISKLLYQHYLGEEVDFELSDNYTQLMTDFTFGVPSDMSALSHAACSQPRYSKTFSFVFNYHGDRSTSDMYNATTGRNWVTHFDDLIYLFPAEVLFGGGDPLSNPRDLAVRKIMTQLWVNFATTGNPTPDNSLGFTWEATQNNDIKTLNIGPSPFMIADPLLKVRELYRSVLDRHEKLLQALESYKEEGVCNAANALSPYGELFRIMGV